MNARPTAESSAPTSVDPRHALIAIAGAGGFIGGHLVADLQRRGFHRIRAADIKPLDRWYQLSDQVENRILDLSHPDSCRDFLQGADLAYNLACDMGGMGFIEAHKAQCMLSVLINTHLLRAAVEQGVRKYFFASTACVYPAGRQDSENPAPLREEEAYPAMPEDGYGWEKLFSERMCRHFMEDFGLPVRIARFHNVYGPHGTWCGGREKAPAALCRKVIEAKRSGSGEIEIWGDGRQTRSFTYIDDCLEGIRRLMESDYQEPLNIGSGYLISLNQLVDIIEEIAGVQLRRRYRTEAPLGVRGRSSDNTLIRRLFDWEPEVPLHEGLRKTYGWIEAEVGRQHSLADGLSVPG